MHNALSFPLDYVNAMHQTVNNYYYYVIWTCFKHSVHFQPFPVFYDSNVTVQNSKSMVKDAIWTFFKYSAVVFTFSHFNLLCFMISLHVCTLCPKKTTLMLHTIDSTHINRFR